MKFSKIAKVSITLFLASISLQSYASWQVATGIGQNREDAVNDAIHNLLMQSGADIRLEQSYKSGVLNGTSYGPASQNIIKKLVVLETQHTLNRKLKQNALAQLLTSQSYHCPSNMLTHRLSKEL